MTDKLAMKGMLACVESIERVADKYSQYVGYHKMFDYIGRVTEEVQMKSSFKLHVGEIILVKMDEGPVGRNVGWANGHKWSCWSARGEYTCGIQRKSFEILAALEWDK